MPFSVVGDSNVVRHMNQANCRSPELSSAEVKPCSKVESLDEVIRSLRIESTICILSCLTNFLTDTTGSSESVSLRVEPVLIQVRDILFSYCQEQPERYWVLAPPMYRLTPLWYLDNLSEIMVKFSSVMSEDRPRNLLLLPSFSNPSLEADGVHLSPYSGYNFILYLFDTSASLVAQSKKPPASRELAGQQNESIRCLEDRVSVIEQDHRRLNRSFELKSAIQAEANEHGENLRYVSLELCLYLNPISLIKLGVFLINLFINLT